MPRDTTLTRPRAVGLALAAAGTLGSLLVSLLPATGSLAASGCGTNAAGGGTGNQDPAGVPIVVGASLPLTGALSGNARALQGGLLAAVAQVNALGGILGRQVVINAQDDASIPSQASTVAMSLVSAQVLAMIGPTGSQQVSQILPYITMNGLLDVSATATSAALTSMYAPKQGVFFRTVPSDAYQAIAVALFAKEGPAGNAAKGGCRTMDVVHNADTYGDPLSKAIESYFTSHGGTVPPKGDFPVPENAQGNYNAQVAQVLKDLPDCLVLAVYPPTAAQFMHNLSDALASGAPTGWSNDFFVIGTDGAYDPSLITDGLANPSDPTSQSWVNGTYGPPVYGTVALTNDPTRPQYNELVSIYDAEVGLQPGQTDLDPYTANQYDAIVLELLAMEAAGTTTQPRAVQEAMFNVSRGKSCSATPYGPADLADAIAALQKQGDINYQGASGDVDFDDYGDVVANFLVWQVKPDKSAATGSSFVNHTEISAMQLAGAMPGDAGGCK
jgi:neutral amino acid transport system substrate-binding protein